MCGGVCLDPLSLSSLSPILAPRLWLWLEQKTNSPPQCRFLVFFLSLSSVFSPTLSSSFPTSVATVLFLSPLPSPTSSRRRRLFVSDPDLCLEPPLCSLSLSPLSPKQDAAFGARSAPASTRTCKKTMKPHSASGARVVKVEGTPCRRRGRASTSILYRFRSVIAFIGIELTHFVDNMVTAETGTY